MDVITEFLLTPDLLLLIPPRSSHFSIMGSGLAFPSGWFLARYQLAADQYLYLLIKLSQVSTNVLAEIQLEGWEILGAAGSQE